MNKVYVAGAGVISCLGQGWGETFQALSNSASGLSTLQIDNSPKIPAGVVQYTNDELAQQAGCSSAFPRAALLGIHAAKEAYLQSRIQHMERWRVGMIVGNMYGGMDKAEQFYQAFQSNTDSGRLRDVVRHSPGQVTQTIAEALSVKEYFTTISSGSASAINALIQGTRLVQQNKLDVVFAGGTESLSQYLLRGLSTQGLLDHEAARPFDFTCAGLNPGEGSAFIVLTSQQVCERENLTPLAEISGHGIDNLIVNDFPSTLKEEAAFRAMTSALISSGLNSSDIDYLNLFGTGVPDFDLIESSAVEKIFGQSTHVMSSTKPFTGFTSGACGAIESVIALMSISHQCVFPTLGFDKPIPEVGLQPGLDFRSAEINHAMVNSFSFLGNCASLIFSKHKP